MTDLDPAAIMAAHELWEGDTAGPPGCKAGDTYAWDGQQWRPCDAYLAAAEAVRLTAEVTAERAKVQRMLDLGRFWNGPEHGPGCWDSSHARELRAAADDTLDWSHWKKVWYADNAPTRPE